MEKGIKKLLFVFGTRPEAIKMSPLIREAKKNSQFFEVIVCVTGQHKEMLDTVLSFFGITPDFNLNLMQPNQDIADITSIGLAKLKTLLQAVDPDLVLVQGDTTSAFIGALAAYYHKCKIVHIEAGLRSGNKNSPYPEEMYRTLIGHMADYHFVPTRLGQQNLAKENIEKNVYIVGNTVIDALFCGLDIIENSGDSLYYEYFNFLNFDKKIILVTAHRRESFGEPLKNICNALKQLALEYPEIQFVYPVHMNPNIKQVVGELLKDINNFFLIEPLDYPFIIWLMKKSYLIITDSGGIQEEAPSLGKPVLVTREVTERIEGVEAGVTKLVGTNTANIIAEARRLLLDEKYYRSVSNSMNPYGDGKSSNYILNILKGVEID